jgi:hypothetical protein
MNSAESAAEVLSPSFSGLDRREIGDMLACDERSSHALKDSKNERPQASEVTHRFSAIWDNAREIFSGELGPLGNFLSGV